MTKAGPLREDGAHPTRRGRAVFIVRLRRDELGRITGIVEWVGGGEKTRVGGAADVAAVIEATLARTDGDATPVD